MNGGQASIGPLVEEGFILVGTFQDGEYDVQQKLSQRAKCGLERLKDCSAFIHGVPFPSPAGLPCLPAFPASTASSGRWVFEHGHGQLATWQPWY